MQVANTMPSQWGPALLVCFTVVLGMFFQNSRISDLKSSVDHRFDDLQSSFDRRFDDLKTSIDNRFEEMKDYIKSEFKRVDERIDRLESPIARK